MASAVLSSAPVLRVPAWKRLGLKLKSAQDTAPTAPEPTPVAIAGEIKEHKRRRQARDNPTKSKKIKSSSSIQVSPSNKTSQDPIQITPTLQRQKSVTFTPETKTEDGDSIKQLFSAWVAEQKSQDPAFVESASLAFHTPEPPKVVEQIDITLDEAERRVKRVKKSKTTKPDKIVKPNKQPINSALQYLKLFYHSKATWKFNKIHQIQLLRNAFDVEKIPSEYSELLYVYIAGMKGEARTHLRNAALAIKLRDREEEGREASASAEAMDSIRRKEEEFEAALKEHVASMTTLESSSRMGYEEGVLLGLSDFAMKKRMAKRMRAERILEQLTQEYYEPADEMSGDSGVLQESSDNGNLKRLKLNDGSAQRVRRRRKLRTTAVDESSSSSDSSSSSEDESSEESEKSVEDDGATSSSSSSSSTSEGEGQSESSSDESESSEGE